MLNNKYIITGDFNIDLLKSTPDNKIGRYHQNLESLGCMGAILLQNVGGQLGVKPIYSFGRC